VAELGARLHEVGHDPSVRTLTIWEGVTMYLREPAIDACLRAIRSYSAARSALVLTYVDARVIRAPEAEQRFTQRLVALVGEPHVFGFPCGGLPPYAEERGYRLGWDASDRELADRYLPQLSTGIFDREERRIAELRVM